MKPDNLNKSGGTVAIPFLSGLGYPLKKIKDKRNDFLYLTALISFLTTAAYSVFVPVSFPFFAVFFLIFCGYYINKWFDVSENGEKLKLKINLKDFKTACWFLLYLGLWVIFCFSSYILSARKPSADWREELLFFIAVSLVMVIAMLLLMNFVCFIRFLKKKKWLCLRKTFWPVLDNLYKLFGWFFIYLIFFAYILYLTASLQPPLPVKLFLSYFILYAAVAMLVSSLSYQEKFIFKDES